MTSEDAAFLVFIASLPRKARGDFYLMPFREYISRDAWEIAQVILGWRRKEDATAAQVETARHCIKWARGNR